MDVSLPDLPVSESLPALLTTLAANRNAVLVAPPGAGKTTLVPLALLDTVWRGDGKIIMLEPRRLAARAAATRMAHLIGEKPGETIGYRTRLDSAVSPKTRVEVITEGLLVRRLQSDPGLENTACVILDEIHERALDADLALAFCLDLQRNLRPELRLLAMSATPDTQRLATLLDAEVISSPGKMHPVTIQHTKRDIAQVRDLPHSMAAAIRAALAEHHGDILAFLPGMGEIRRTEAALESCGAIVLPLHGDLPVTDQDRALTQAATRRVVLATSIAETSLTVPGVRVVIDGGYRRAPRLDQATGLTRLATLRVSRAAADQRSGRAGREAPGVAIRLWTEALHRGLAQFEKPEILEADLASLRLDCAGWGAAPQDLPFPDPPPAGPLAAADTLLHELGALDKEGHITDLGRRMARLGAHPRLSAMMLAAKTDEDAALAATMAAILEERDIYRDREPPADISFRLHAVTHNDPAADRGTVSRIRQAASQYRRRLRLPPETRPDGDPGNLLAAGFPDRIAQARGEIGAFRLSGGGSGKLPRADKLATQKFLVVPSLELKASARIRLAAPFDPENLPPALAAQVTETVETTLDPTSGAVLARRRRRLGTLILSDRTEATASADIAATLAATIAAQSLRPLDWTETARQLQARAARLRALDPDFPDLSDETLIAEVQDWLTPYLAGCSRLTDAAKLDLHAIFRDRLGHTNATRLDKDLPTHLTLPGGRALIDYTQPEPTASARAQAFYGLRETPKLAQGRIPLKLALLSPAQRPIAITGDIATFWKSGWPDARKDMRGRYPRHNWPEDGGAP